jgi:NADP-dependent 3-hydroxy acid dehydrogenase YdfG
VFPGRTATPLQAWVSEVEARPYIPEDLLQPEDVAEAVVNVIVLPDTAEVTEIMIRPAKSIRLRSDKIAG